MDKVLSMKRYRMKGPGHIIIGDPMYLEHIEAGTANKGMKSLILDMNIPKVRNCSFTIKEIETQDEEFPQYGPYYSYIVDICFSNSEMHLKTYEENKYYPKLVKTKHELGCDTAQFDISVGSNKYEEFHTGADGYYGHVIVHKDTAGGLIELEFDADLFDRDGLIQSFMYLFDFTEKDLIYSSEKESDFERD